MRPHPALRDVSQVPRIASEPVGRSSAHDFSVAVNLRVVHVVPVGALDLAALAELEQRLLEVKELGCEQIVLDLRQVTFVDLRVVALICDWDAVPTHDGVELWKIIGSPAVRRGFELADRLPIPHLSSV